MKRLHSLIRRDATLLYAKLHPDVRLADVGIALGFPEDQVDSAVSAITRRAGIRRPRGFSAPSYSPQSKIKAWGKTWGKPQTWSRSVVLKLLATGMTQTEIAAKVGGGCTQFAVSQLSIAHQVGGRYQQRQRRIERQKLLVAALSENPDATAEELQEELGIGIELVYDLLQDLGLRTYRQERKLELAAERQATA